MFKTSQEWYKEREDEVIILDFDGWDRSPHGWEYSFNQELITKEEFERRLCQSTIIWNTDKL